MLLRVGEFEGISKASAVAVQQVSQVNHYIKIPLTPEEKHIVQQKFCNIARVPCVIGAVECTHVRIQSPGGNTAEYYRNRKGYFSWNVQVVSDADLHICDIVARWPGSTHDQHIFNTSYLKAILENGDKSDGILLGDSGYGNTNYLLLPLEEINPDHPEERLYNENQIHSRNVVERCFRVWKILSENSKTVIVAAAVLHNIIFEKNNDVPPNEIQIIDEVEELQRIQQVLINNINNVRRNTLIQTHLLNLI